MTFLEEMFGLTGKTAIVAGGAGVIGTALSEALLKAGANVVIWSRTAESIEAALTKLGGSDPSSDRLKGLQVDAGSESEIEKALKTSEELFSPPEILVNAVGGNMGKSPLVDTDMVLFEKILSLNLTAGLMTPTKAAARYWIERKIKGTIINLTSMTSYNPLSGVWGYDAAKAGVLNLTMATANELAPHGIRVNAVAPGFFIGKQNKALLIDEKTGEYTDRGRAVIAHTPFGRFGEVDELMGAVLLLASSKASGFMTGVSIPVDGGYLVHNI